MRQLLALGLQWFAKAAASGFFLSYVPARVFNKWSFSGAGLVGSLWGVAALPWFPQSPYRQTAVWLGVLAISVVISDWTEDLMGRTDDPRIVIDEFVGYWTAVMYLPRSPVMLVAAFVLFRVFDVLKPGWVRRAGDLPGGWGVVLDDVLAGACANVLLQLGRNLYPV